MNEKDIYFLENYGKIFEKNGEGKLETYLFQSNDGSILYRYLKREIPIKLNNITYYDTITPYGYGGPILLELKNLQNKKKLFKDFNEALEKKFKDEKIVSSFIRFHPLIKNQEISMREMDIEYNRDTIAIDLSSEKLIWENIHSKCRNMIRKAEKNNIEIVIKETINEEDIDKFYELYKNTMIKNSASNYYIFSKEFFMNHFDLLEGNIKLVIALYEEKVICSAIILEYDDYIHYHFSGSDMDYKSLAATNLLLYKVALYGYKNGFKYFHLGGGYSGNEDSLFKFKHSFNKNEKLNFFIGKKIYDIFIYENLIEEKKKVTKELNEKYFPLYR